MPRQNACLSTRKSQIGDALGELLDRAPQLPAAPGNLVVFFKALAMCEGLLQAIDSGKRALRSILRLDDRKE